MSTMKFLDTSAMQTFAKELADFMWIELESRKGAKDAHFQKAAEKTLVKAAKKLQTFKADHSMNFYQRAKLANTFLWTLKEHGCAADYADELTEWLTLRL